MAYKAIGDSVIVEVPEVSRETVRESGLVLLEAEPTKQKTVIGTIVSVGEGRWDEKNAVYVPLSVNVGDKIVLSLSTGVALDGRHRMVRLDDIFAVVE